MPLYNIGGLIVGDAVCNAYRSMFKYAMNIRLAGLEKLQKDYERFQLWLPSQPTSLQLFNIFDSDRPVTNETLKHLTPQKTEKMKQDADKIELKKQPHTTLTMKRAEKVMFERLRKFQRSSNSLNQSDIVECFLDKSGDNFITLKPMLGLELLLTSLELPIAPPSSMLGRATAAMRQTFFPSVAQSHRHFEGDKSGPNLSPAISVFITPLDV